MEITITTNNKQQEKYLFELLDSKGIKYLPKTKMKSSIGSKKPSIADFLGNVKASLKRVKKRKKYFDVDFIKYEYLMKKHA